MAKRNVTLSHFDGRPDFVTPVHAPSGIPAGRAAIRTLGWNRSEKHCDWDDFAKSIQESAQADAAFFVDSSFLDRHEIPTSAWNALLSRRIVITPGILKELGPDCLKIPCAHKEFRNVVVSALKGEDSAVQLLDPTEWDAPTRKAAQYYIQLITHRKLIGHMLKAEFEAKNGRPPSEDELVSTMQRGVRDRGIVLAQKGLRDLEKPNLTADEELVVLAVFHAILTGRETTILTRDRDVLEQFYKAVYLFCTDYRAFLVAESYRDTPENIIVKKPPYEGCIAECFHEGDNLFLLLAPHFIDWVLPENTTPVVLGCVRLGGTGKDMKMSALQFCAGTEMREFINQKGQLNGLNSDVFGDKNIHIGLTPPLPKGFSGHAIVGKDKRIRSDGNGFAFLDVNYAVMPIERFSTCEFIDDSEREALEHGLRLAGFFLTDRLMFSVKPEWMDISTLDLRAAIRFMDPKTVFLIDQSFLLSEQSERVADVLLERGFETSQNIATLVDRAQGTLVARVVKGDKRIRVLKSGEGGWGHVGYGYYFGLLAFRKLFWKAIKQRVLRDYGRESPDNEWPQIVERYAGIRGRRLTEDAWRRQDDPSLFYGEELLILGLVAALHEGCSVVFLTRDPLFLEQFSKLGRLLTGHYMGYRFGKVYAQASDDFPTYEIEPEKKNSSRGGRIVCHDLQADWKQRILPKSPFFLNLHCWLFGNENCENLRFAPFTYCAERPMHEQVEVIGETEGLCYRGEPDQNVRILRTNGGESASFHDDKLVEFGTPDCPADERVPLRVGGLRYFDLVHAVNDNCDFPMVWHE